MQRVDATFVDFVVRKRSSYKVWGEGHKSRMLWLLADAVTAKYETDREKVIGVAEWVCGAAPHVAAHDTRGQTDHYMIHAYDIVARGWGYCEATAETFATMCWLAGYPSRIISIQTEMPEPISGHHVTEAFLDGKWSFIDADMFRYFEIEDGTLGSCRELRDRKELIEQQEQERGKKEWTGALHRLNEFKYLEEDGRSTYAPLFGNIYVQEGIYSLDGYYGRWIKCTPETEEYLYGTPQHPDVRELLKGRLSFTYVRDTTKIDDHFHYSWEPPYNVHWPGAPQTLSPFSSELGEG